MPFSIDFLDDGRVLEWEATADGAVVTERDDYTSRFCVGARDPETDLDLTTLQSVYDQHPDVVATAMVARQPGFRRDEETVLAVDVAHIDRVTSLARQARQLLAYPVGDLACFNVDFSREFRYCLEADVDPTPASELSTLRLSVAVTETSNDIYGELSVAGDDDFKIRGIEVRQRSTPQFIEDIQRDCLERLDATRSPDAVLDCLQDAIKRLHAGTVPVKQLVERNRVSKPLKGYTQNTQNVAALKRAREQDLAVHPEQDLEYVVVDDERSSRERVALAHEEMESYDASYYETQLVRAVESVLSPLGWDRTEIRRELAETRVPELTAFANTENFRSYVELRKAPITRQSTIESVDSPARLSDRTMPKV